MLTIGVEAGITCEKRRRVSRSTELPFSSASSCPTAPRCYRNACHAAISSDCMIVGAHVASFLPRSHLR